MRISTISEDEVDHATARTIHLALASSPLLLGGILWFALAGTGGASGPPGLVAWTLWGVMSGLGLLVWWLFRRRAVEPLTAWSRHRREQEGFHAATLLTYLIIAWAGAEGLGFAGVIVHFFLEGDVTMLATSLAASVLCFALSAPKESWFRTLRREAGGDPAGA